MGDGGAVEAPASTSGTHNKQATNTRTDLGCEGQQRAVDARVRSSEFQSCWCCPAAESLLFRIRRESNRMHVGCQRGGSEMNAATHVQAFKQQ
jgi:hypothetical protein